MGTDEVLQQIGLMSNADRLELIEVATRLVRENLPPSSEDPRDLRERRMRKAASRLQELYEPGGELTVWTALDGEEVADDYL